MPDLAVFLLGSPRLEHGGKAVHLHRRKALALLAFLAVTGRAHERDGPRDPRETPAAPEPRRARVSEPGWHGGPSVG